MSDEQPEGIEGNSEPEEEDQPEHYAWPAERAKMSSDEQLDFFEQQAMNQFKDVDFTAALNEAVEVRPVIEVLKNKRALVDVPFVCVQVRFNPGEYGIFCSMTCVTQHPVGDSNSNTIVINDGSTGLARQMYAIVKENGADKPFYFPKGLRESVYYIDKDTRQVVGKSPVPNSIPASTFYLNV